LLWLLFAARKIVAKARQHVIRVHDPDRDLLGHREIDAVPNLEGKGIVAR
jgi:hypothetical protein